MARLTGIQNNGGHGMFVKKRADLAGGLCVGVAYGILEDEAATSFLRVPG
jgi:hypothetical protein